MRNRLVLVSALMTLAGPAAMGGAQVLDPPPKADYAMVDDFSYPDDKAAQEAWRPMYPQTPVRVVDIAGRKALKMPCKFRGTTIERASWDTQVKLDLGACRGLRFQFCCPDASPISGFSLYLKSGEGWYHATFSQTAAKGWQAVEIDKSASDVEGNPAGWGRIEAIRISAWRGKDADTEFYIAGLGLAGADAPIAVIRAEALAARSSAEARSAREFTTLTARYLDDLGLSSVVISDLDVTAERLKGKKLVVLPHNPGMSDKVADEIAAFVAGGGKVIAFYVLPPRLGQVAGIDGGPHVSQKYPGYFASIRPCDQALPGMPAIVAQRSWNIHSAKCVQGRSRVAALWYDDKGKPTGDAAIIVSDNCVFMTHVLLGDDPANKRRLLLAMAGHLVGELQEKSARRRIERIALVGPYGSFDQARAGILALPGAGQDAKSMMDAVVKLREQANELCAAGKYAESIALADRAGERLLEAYCAAQQPLRGEHRAFWCHSAFGIEGMEWDQAIRILADNGFTAILPNMLWAGAAFYESSVLPVAPEVKDRGDQVSKCLAACRKHHLACHVWKVNYNLGWRSPKEFVAKLKEEGRLQVDRGGEYIEHGWLCPSHPANQKLEIDSMIEVATRYDVDGIHFDYIRYPGPEGCFCGGCRERFEKALGAKVANWPADLRKPELAQKWHDFRREQITTVVAAVAQAVRQVKPKVKISAAVFRNWSVDRDSVGQDWKLWCDRGYLDFVCPMDYTEHDAQFENMVTQQIPCAGKVPCYPGIGLSCWPSRDVCKLIEQINITRRLGTGGFTVFNYSGEEARNIVPLCGKGITRKE